MFVISITILHVSCIEIVKYHRIITYWHERWYHNNYRLDHHVLHIIQNHSMSVHLYRNGKTLKNRLSKEKNGTYLHIECIVCKICHLKQKVTSKWPCWAYQPKPLFMFTICNYSHVDIFEITPTGRCQKHIINKKYPVYIYIYKNYSTNSR